jgi:hypothetical protein
MSLSCFWYLACFSLLLTAGPAEAADELTPCTSNVTLANVNKWLAELNPLNATSAWTTAGISHVEFRAYALHAYQCSSNT